MTGAGLAPPPSRAKRTELSAAYLNTIAGSLFTAGCIAPVAAAVFGFGIAPPWALTLWLGVATSVVGSVVAQLAARRFLKELDR